MEARRSEGESTPPEEMEQLLRLMQHITTDAGNTREEMVYEAEGRCSVCFEPSIVCGESPRLCGSCDALVCLDCFLKFTKTTTEGALYAVPPIRCPYCLARVRTGVWSSVLTKQRSEQAKELLAKYRSNAKHMLGVRCSGCEEFSSLFRKAAATTPEDREAVLTRVLAKFNDKQKLEICKLWKQFDDAEINAPAFVRDVMDIVCPNDPATRDPFRRRTLYNRKAQRFCRRMQNLFTDMERRLSFQVAFMCKYPKFKTRCCRVPCCFLCKITYWHRRETCAERQERQTANAQHCPGCGVATLRTEGCSEIVCVCGTTWDWDGDEDWDDNEEEEEDEEDEQDEDAAVGENEEEDDEGDEESSEEGDDEDDVDEEEDDEEEDEDEEEDDDEDDEEEEDDETQTSSDNFHIENEEGESASSSKSEEELPAARAEPAANSDRSSEEEIPATGARQNRVQARAKRAESDSDETNDNRNDDSDFAQKAATSNSRCIIA